MEIYKPDQSALWDLINRTRITKDTMKDLTDFKSGPINFKIALWNPHTNGVRYLKALLYCLCAVLTDENRERLSRISNRETGNPFTIQYKGERICLDYLQAIYELEFIARHVRLDGMHILEIGAGYGRTCHAILSNHDVATYCIIDLQNCLELSRRYLETVLDRENFGKLCFLPAEDCDRWADLCVDLCINIDSFAEMDHGAVRYYLAYINEKSRVLYVKNPVGKYLDPSLDKRSQGEEVVRLALNAGILRDVIDVHDSEMIEAQAVRFVTAYRPGSDWECLAHSWAMPWSHYWQAMYRKVGTSEAPSCGS